MIIIKHRINSIKNLKKTNYKYGVEIDLRSDNKSIYLHHDPFKKGESFEKWLKFYKHKFIVLNVKEEGLEKKIIRLLKKNKISNFFFHDQTFSSLLKNKKKTKVSIRYSEFEDIKNRHYIFKSIKWIWIDHFTRFPLSKKYFKFLRKNKVKICIVSPELVNIKHLYKIKNLFKNLIRNRIKIDAVCTKKPEIWENLNNENNSRKTIQ